MGGVCSAAIQSQNVVGYSTSSTGEQNNFLSIPFATVGGNTADIQSIKIDDGGAGTVGWGAENFAIWEGAPTVTAGTSFQYIDASMDPSGKATEAYWGDPATFEKASFSVAAGQGIVIECAADLTITTAGQVGSDAVPFTTIEQNNFTGNPFPATIDIQAIKISDGGAGTVGWGAENFAIWEGAPTVVGGSSFQYIDASMDPSGKATEAYWGDPATFEKATYPIAAGQGFVIECAAGLTITINPPYSL